MTEEEIIKHLYRYFKARSGSWVCFDHLRMGTGWVCERTIDFFALNTWKGYESIAIEIKVSVSDFAREKSQPEKRMAAQVLCDRFVFVCPEGILKPEHMPAGCELWFCSEAGEIKPVKQNYRGKDKDRLVGPGWPFVASVLRRVMGTGEAA